MALTKLDKNLNIVSALDSEPNDVGGLTSEELKAKFDEGGKAIQEYINETLIPETEAAVEEVRGEIEGAVDEATKNLESQLRGVVLGQIPNGTITEEKLDPEFVNSRYTKEETDELFAEVPAQIADAEKIGDIKATIRNDIGDKWLPCNGEHIDTDQYPELGDMLNWSAIANRAPSTYCIEPQLFGYGSTFVFAGQYSSDYIKIVYSLNGLETTPISSGSNENGGGYEIKSSYIYPRGLYCYNGLWCIVARYNLGHAVYYTTDVTKAANWTSYDIPSGGEPFSLYCHNGLWVISGRTSTNSAEATACVWVSEDPSAGADSWTRYIVDSEIGSCAYYSVYHNGIWTVAGTTDVNKGTQSLQAYTATNVRTSTWSKKVILLQSNYNYKCFADGLFAYDGAWVITSRDNSYYTRIYYTQNPAGEWLSTDPTNPLISGTARGKEPSTIYCHNGLWAYYEYIQYSGYNETYLRTSTNVLSGEWNCEKIGSNETPSATFVSGHGIFTAGHGPSSAYSLNGHRKSKVVPNISIADTNTFIKAKM